MTATDQHKEEEGLERRAEREAARRDLLALGAPSIKLLREVVEKTCVTRKKASRAAINLEDQGFVFIRDTGDTWIEEVTITASLFGEDALDALDEESGEQEEIIQENKPR